MDKALRKTELRLSAGQNDPLPLSLPLVLSDDFEYDTQTHTLLKKEKPSTSPNPLHLVDITVKLLRTIKKPIAVLSICGPYRTGKSYFLSRLLGSTETFRLGHSMSACTHGIWMATSVLECDDFVVVLLDTEGINSAGAGIGANSSHVTNLLTLTVLLSSTLIYNSRSVPRGTDIKKLSSFVNLSKYIVEFETETGQEHSKLMSNHLPHFIWLLRDVDMVPTDSKGESMCLTDYLVNLLKSIQKSSTQTLANKVSTALLELFPTIRCTKLPPPTGDPSILTDIVNNTPSLRVQFNEELKEVAESILQSLQPKCGYNTTTSVDGFILASMLEQYLISVNAPGKVAVLESTWCTAVQLKLTHLADQLAEEYEEEMETVVSPRFPLEDGLNGETGDTLLNAHLEIFAKKRLVLQKNIQKYQTSNHGFETNRQILSKFDASIVEYSHDKKEVVSGKLFHFVRQNYQKSLDVCMNIYAAEYKHVETLVDKALATSEPTNIHNPLVHFEEQYRENAIGPAKENVYKQKRSESQRRELELLKIPGKVNSLRVVGKSGQLVKLRWKPPTENPQAAERYEVHVKPKGKEMFLARTRKRCSVVLDNLENSKFHLFMVRARNDKHIGGFGPVIYTKTDISGTAFALTFTTLLIFGGFFLVASIPHMYGSSMKSPPSNMKQTIEEFDTKLESELADHCESENLSGLQDVTETSDEDD